MSPEFEKQFNEATKSSAKRPSMDEFEKRFNDAKEGGRLDNLPSTEEFEKLTPEEQKALVEATDVLVDRKLNRAERRQREKYNRKLRREKRKQDGN